MGAIDMFRNLFGATIFADLLVGSKESTNPIAITYWADRTLASQAVRTSSSIRQCVADAAALSMM
ncbi:hypothetical protein HAX54_042922, partial [Datura stramonium]|nr:hypothetical protein [Datura stramonium]